MIVRPFLLQPAFKDYLWGGNKLRQIYGKRSDLKIISESWELSVCKGSESVIASGKLNGMSLREFAQKYPGLLGVKDGIKILIKLIDAKQDLSVQVHPCDDYAARVENSSGKTEAWHVLECEPGSYLYCGFLRETTAEEVRERIQNNTIEKIMQKVFVEPGDTYFIPAGTIHAIGAGIVIAEIQQNSDLTYRVYDFNRRGPDGNPRELHVEKALDVMNFMPATQCNKDAPIAKKAHGYTLSRIAHCDYFTVDKLDLDGSFELQMDGRYLSLLCTDGTGRIDCAETLAVNKGDSIFIPADNSRFSISGTGNFLITSQN